MKPQSKENIIKQISELLDQRDCVIRIQREMTPHDQERSKRAFVLGSRVTIIVTGTKPATKENG